MTEPLIRPTDRGLYCDAGDFHIDPWRPVDRAVVTHAHSDHARPGCAHYLCSQSGESVTRKRIGTSGTLETLAWGERRSINGVSVSLHPAGHILGSAQVRVEHRGEVWVVSGDYKTAPDVSCESFEPVRCDVFITESTFGLPVYRWPETPVLFAEINRWWRDNRERGLTSVVFAYALGKAQRILAGVDASIGPIGVHGAVNKFLPDYDAAGIPLAPTIHARADNARELKGMGLIVAPGSALGSPWMRRFGRASLAFASGWMRIRGTRRRRGLDRGFVLSDHADWNGLVETIRATGASRIGVTHGTTGPFVRWLREQGHDAWTVPTRFTGESADGSAEADPDGGDAESGAA